MNLAQGSGTTEMLCDWVNRTSYEDISAGAIHATKRLICDTIGCAVGARNLDSASIVVEVVAGNGGVPESTILGSRLKVSPAAAAFANGYLGNVLDADETLGGRSHHAAATVFPALALGESLGANGPEVIAAVTLGYDLGARVGHSLSLGSATGLVHGWLGFAATTAAAKILRLDAVRLANAIGIAGWTSPLPCAALRWQQLAAPRPMLKVAPHGFISQQGVLAAQLAEKGFVGDRTVLEGEEGYWKITGATKCDWNLMVADLGKSWWIEEVMFKGYALCGAGSQSVDLFRQIIAEHKLRPEEIEKVSVWAIEAALHQLTPPESQTDVPFSVAFALAAVAFGIELGPRSQSWDVIRDPRLSDFTRKIDVFPNSDLPAANGEVSPVRAMSDLPNRGIGGVPYPIPTKVEIMARGRTFEASSDFAWGNPWTTETAMTDEELKHKFRTFCSGVLRSQRIEEVLDVVFRLEESEDVGRDLMSLLA
jgi:2-methylcitrate dehydratase PrpD